MKRFYLGALALAGLFSTLVVVPLFDAPELHAQGDGPQYSCQDGLCSSPSPWVDSTATYFLEYNGVTTVCEVEVHYRTRTCDDGSEYEILGVTPLDPECRDVTIDPSIYIEQAERHVATDPAFPVAPNFRPPKRQKKKLRGYTSNCWKTTAASPFLAPLAPCTQHCCHKKFELYTTASLDVLVNYKSGVSNNCLKCPAEPQSACHINYDCKGNSAELCE